MPRFLHKLYANLFGYYWIPCPLCGEYMGGHEHSWKESGHLDLGDGRGKTTCRDCKEDAEKINRENGYPTYMIIKE